MRGGASSTRLAGVVLFVLATAPPLGHADGEDAASIVRRTSVEVARARDLDVAVAAATAGVDALSRRGHVDDDHAAALYGVLATALAARDGRLYGGAGPAPAHVTARKVRPLDPGPGESGPLRPSWLVAGPALALYDRALLRSDGSMRPVGRGNGTAERAASLFAQVGDPVRAARTRIALAASWIEELRRLDNSIMVRDFPLLAAAHALGACGPDAESLPEWRELRRRVDEALDVLAARADRLRARAGGHASYAEVLGSLRLASARVRPHDEAGRRAALDDVGAVRDVAGAQLRALPDDSTFLSLVEDAAKVEVELCRDVGDGAGMRAALERLGARFATDAAWQQADGRAKLAEFPSLVTPWADVAVLEALAVAVADGDPAKAVAARLSAVRALPPTAFTQATVASVASDPTLPARVRFGARVDEARVAFGRARPDEGRAALEAARAVAAGTPDLDADLPSLAWALECRRIGRTGEALDGCMAILRVRPEHVAPTTWTGTRAAVTAAQLFAATANYDAAHAVVDRLVAALRKDAPLHRALAAPAGPAEGPTASAYAAAVDLSGLRDLCDHLGRADDAGYFAGPIGPPLARPFPTAFDRLAQGDVAAAVDAARTDRGVGSEAPVVPGDARMVLADVLLSAGESEEARAVVEEVDRAIRARASPEGASHELRVGVWAQTRLAELAASRGDLAAARAHANRARALVRLTDVVARDDHDPERRRWARRDPAASPGDRVGLDAAETLLRRVPLLLARLLVADGLPDEARYVLEAELRIHDGAVPVEVPDRAAILVLLGRVEASTGAVASARGHLREAVELLDRSRARAPSELVEALVAMGDVEHGASAVEAALAAYTRASDVARRELSASHPLAIHASVGRARCLAAAGRVDEAVTALRAVVGDVASRNARLLPAAPSGERAGLLRVTAEVTDAWCGVSEALPLAGYEEVLRLRGSSTDAVAAETRAFTAADGAGRARHVELRARRRELSALTLDEIGRGWRRVAWADRVGQAAARVDDALRKVLAADPTLATELRRASAPLAEMRAALGRADALVDVVRGGTVYRAWVVRREGPVRRVTIGPVEAVDEALQRLRDAVHEEASEETEAYRSAVAQARRVAWAPVADLLGADVSTVHLVLDGGYAAAPVERIPHREGGAALATVLRVARQPTVTSVLPAGGALGRGALLVGDVDFDLAFRPGRPALTGPSPSRLLARVPGLRPFTRLPATVAELTAIQAIFGARAGGLRTDTLVEDRASEAALRAAVAGRAFVHLATHGFVRAELAAPIALRDDLSAYLRPGIERFAFQVDPLAASGLALAGANARERADDDDGILTAREATELDLRGARLVVLSACDTARGVAVAGEGLVGLVQAFRAAGARSVVGSLWPVDDAVTAELMPRLYDALLERDRTVPEALAEATRRLAAERGGKAALPPRHLAAFVAFGTGR